MPRLIAPLLAVLLLTHAALADLRETEGVIPLRHVPKPGITDTSVLLNVPHIRQKPDLCVPASTAMVLRYYGHDHSQSTLKQMAESHKPPGQRNQTFTYWKDMDHALRQLGARWKIRDYRRNRQGFLRGLKDIKASLRRGRPVLIEVHQGPGHTFVVIGYDDARQMVYVRDPNLSASRARELSYATLETNWHNHRFSPTRSAFFSTPPR